MRPMRPVMTLVFITAILAARTYADHADPPYVEPPAFVPHPLQSEVPAKEHPPSPCYCSPVPGLDYLTPEDRADDPETEWSDDSE